MIAEIGACLAFCVRCNTSVRRFSLYAKSRSTVSRVRSRHDVLLSPRCGHVRHGSGLRRGVQLPLRLRLRTGVLRDAVLAAELESVSERRRSGHSFLLRSTGELVRDSSVRSGTRRGLRGGLLAGAMPPVPVSLLNRIWGWCAITAASRDGINDVDRAPLRLTWRSVRAVDIKLSHEALASVAGFSDRPTYAGIVSVYDEKGIHSETDDHATDEHEVKHKSKKPFRQWVVRFA